MILSLTLRRSRLLVIALAFFLAFALSLPALAQTDEATSVSTDADTTDVVEIDELDVDIDEETGEVVDTSLEDIEIDVPEKAPGRFGLLWRGFKERVSLATTIDPVKKAEKRVKFAEERLRIAEKIAANAENPAAQERAEKVIERANNFFAKVEERKEEWLEKKDDRAAKLLKNVANHQIRKEKLLDKIEKHIPEDRLEEFQARREEFLEKGKRLFEEFDEEEIGEEIKKRIKHARKKIDEHAEEIREFKQEHRELFEAAKDGDEDARAKLEELRVERQGHIEEQKKKYEVFREELKERKEKLRAAAEGGDEEAREKIRAFEGRPNYDAIIENSDEFTRLRKAKLRNRINDHRGDVEEYKDELLHFLKSGEEGERPEAPAFVGRAIRKEFHRPEHEDDDEYEYEDEEGDDRKRPAIFERFREKREERREDRADRIEEKREEHANEPHRRPEAFKRDGENKIIDPVYKKDDRAGSATDKARVIDPVYKKRDGNSAENKRGVIDPVYRERNDAANKKPAAIQPNKRPNNAATTDRKPQQLNKVKVEVRKNNNVNARPAPARKPEVRANNSRPSPGNKPNGGAPAPR